ncbi:MAG: YceD family protein [Paracoccaceae bacterium]
MADAPDPTRPIRLADLSGREPLVFALRPEAQTREALARELGLDALRKLSFSGALRPEGREDWVLDAQLGATVVQPCVVTLRPVTTRIDAPVTRRYLARMAEPEAEPGAETEMPADDTAEPLPARLDLMAVLAEALALELPDYPRAEEAGPGDARATPPGAAPIEEEEVKPFAGLAALRDKLKRDEE